MRDAAHTSRARDASGVVVGRVVARGVTRSRVLCGACDEDDIAVVAHADRRARDGRFLTPRFRCVMVCVACRPFFVLTARDRTSSVAAPTQASHRALSPTSGAKRPSRSHSVPLSHFDACSSCLPTAGRAGGSLACVS